MDSKSIFGLEILCPVFVLFDKVCVVLVVNSLKYQYISSQYPQLSTKQLVKLGSLNELFYSHGIFSGKIMAVHVTWKLWDICNNGQFKRGPCELLINKWTKTYQFTIRHILRQIWKLIVYIDLLLLWLSMDFFLTSDFCTTGLEKDFMSLWNQTCC